MGYLPSGFILRFFVLFLVPLLALTLPLRAAVFIPVILSGQPTPGIPGATFEPGQVVIKGNQLAMTGSSNGTVGGLWSGTATSLSKLVTIADTAPGLGSRFSTLIDQHVDAQGRVTFRGGAGSSTGLWSGVPGAVQRIVGSGVTAPGTTTAHFGGDFTDFRVGASGQAAFFNQLTGTGIDATNGPSLWVGSPTGLQYVARQGDPVPAVGGLAAGTTFSVINPQFAFNDNSQIAFQSNQNGNPAVLWLGTAGNIQPAAIGGQQAPGLPAGDVFSDFYGVSLNNAGQLAVQARLFGTDVTNNNRQGLWVGTPGGLKFVARGGSQAPGTPAGDSFAGIEAFQSNSIALNAAGQVAFAARLNSGTFDVDDRGVWAGSPGQLQLVGRAGDQWVNGFAASSVQMDDGGDVVVLGGPDAGHSSQLWMYQLGSGQLSPLLADGDTMDVDPGPGVDLRTVTGIYMPFTTGGQDGNFTSLSGAGTLAVTVSFSDGSTGIFISVIPEPTMLAITLASVVLAQRRRRRARG